MYSHKIAYQSFTSHPPLIPGSNAKTIIIVKMIALMIMVQTCSSNKYKMLNPIFEEITDSFLQLISVIRSK